MINILRQGVTKYCNFKTEWHVYSELPVRSAHEHYKQQGSN